MGKEIINVLQTFSGNATVRLLGVLVVVVVLAFFMHKSKTFSGVWEFIANWWILLVFVSIETLLYFYLTNEKDSIAIKMFWQITPAITMALFVGLLSRKTANENRTLQEKIGNENRMLQASVANDNQLIQQMNNLETRKSTAIIQLTSSNTQQMKNGVIELMDIAVEWDSLYSKYEKDLDTLIVIGKIQNIINNVYKTKLNRSINDEKSEGIRTLTTKLQNFTLKNNKLNLVGAWLNDLNLSGLDLKEANLMNATLDGAMLNSTIFTNAHLQDSSLVLAHLTGATLEGAILNGANLTGALLAGLDLTGVNISSDTILTNACLKNTRLLDNSTNKGLLTDDEQNLVIWLPDVRVTIGTTISD